MFTICARQRGIWLVTRMCEVLGVLRSDFHAWLDRPLSDRAIQDMKLVAAIGRSFQASDRAMAPAASCATYWKQACSAACTRSGALCVRARCGAARRGAAR